MLGDDDQAERGGVPTVCVCVAEGQKIMRSLALYINANLLVESSTTRDACSLSQPPPLSLPYVFATINSGNAQCFGLTITL
jgi:hypothetical protein